MYQTRRITESDAAVRQVMEQRVGAWLVRKGLIREGLYVCRWCRVPQPATAFPDQRCRTQCRDCKNTRRRAASRTGP